MSDKLTEKTVKLDTPSCAVKLKLPKLCCASLSPAHCVAHACRPLWIWTWGNDDSDPRISTPTLTAQEMAELDPADLTALSVEVVTFC